MILLMRQPDTRQLIALKIPGDERLFKLFTRNDWRPEGEQARRIALRLHCQQIEEITKSLSSD